MRLRWFFFLGVLLLGFSLLFWFQRGLAVPRIRPVAWQGLLPPSQSWSLGCFRIHWQAKTASQARLEVHHCEQPHVIWSSLPGKGFLAAARGKEDIHESRGSFFIRDQLLHRCEGQSIQGISHQGQRLLVKGELHCERSLDPQAPKKISYTWYLHARTAKQLDFSFKLNHPAYQRSAIRYRSEADERFFGFGEQFTFVDMKGRRLPIFVMEQGIGRGAEPITTGANLTAGAGGAWHTSYAGVPHYITSKMRSLFLKNYEYSVFDMRLPDTVEVSVFSGAMQGQILAASSPLKLIELFTQYAGRMRPLPDWIHSGAIIGMQGGTEAVRKTLATLKKEKTPIAAFWLQDWVGQRITSFGKQLWWNWELDRARYPAWERLVADLKREGIRVMTYINPFLADVSEKQGHRRNLFAEAKKEGYLVKTRDGKPYMIRNTSFSAALIDLSNPKAQIWTKEIIKKELLASGASGWMADFGEALPYDALLHSKESPATFHNRYPEVWARINQEAIDEAGRSGDVVFFTRSGYTQSPRFSTLFWLGDQLVSWDRYDGIKTAVMGLLSSGFSGYSLNHSDIGGYTTISHPIKNYHRSKELMMRWIELNAFTPIFRTHEGNIPEKNHQFDRDEETRKHFGRFARIYEAWGFYRKLLIAEAASRGWPVIRHPFLVYPKDPTLQRTEYLQFFVGDAFLVAPILDPGARLAYVYLPKGRWIHLWSQRAYGSTKKGDWYAIPAPMGKIPVFFKQGCSIGARFLRELKERGLL